MNAADLLRVPRGPITEAGLRQNVSVGVQYVAHWLAGAGCVPLNDLMEDAATAEISRAQLWQWIRHSAQLDDGRAITAELFHAVLAEELAAVRARVGDAVFAAGNYARARDLFVHLVLASEFEEFLTLTAYDQLLTFHTTSLAS